VVDDAETFAARRAQSSLSAAEVKARIVGARRAERMVPIPMRGDLAAQCEQLERELQDLELDTSGPGASLGGNPQAREIAERIEALREEMRDSILVFTLRALPARRAKGGKPSFTQLKDSHPPREGNALDKENGVNMDEFNEELLKHSIVDPVLDDEMWEALLGNLSDGTYTLLIGNCYGVNQSDTDIPFSVAASQILKSSDPG
jgi:hypothetical protein